MNDYWQRVRSIHGLVAPASTRGAVFLDLWERLGIAVRCGYCPGCPCVALHYTRTARRVIACGMRPEMQVHRRTFEVLLQAARDEALPWPWRRICLAFAAQPLDHLQSMLWQRDPSASENLHAEVQHVGEALARTMPGHGLP